MLNTKHTLINIFVSGIAPALVELFGARDISLKYSVCLSGELFGCALFYLLSVGSVKLYNELVSLHVVLILNLDL